MGAEDWGKEKERESEESGMLGSRDQDRLPC